MIGEPVAAQFGLGQPERLELAAAGAVEHQDPILCCVVEFGGGHRVASRSEPALEQVADGERQFGSVERVQVNVVDPVVDQLGDLFGGQFGGDLLCRLDIVVESGETLGDAVGYRRTAAGGEPGDGRERVDREDAGR